MSARDELIYIIVILLLVLGLFVMFYERDEMRREAIQRNAAEWVVDEDGCPTFTWKPIKQ